MSILPRQSHILVLCLSAALGGCSSLPGTDAAPVQFGSRCSSDLPRGTDAVHILIEFDPSPGGVPASAPDACRVRKGTPVYLVTSAGVTTTFDIQFKQAGVSLLPVDGRAADPAQPGIWEQSQPDGGREVLLLDADNGPDSYFYNIRANGQTVDPVIIIER